jgi:pimeloyl-ACP methyl ester carboxylesterase
VDALERAGLAWRIAYTCGALSGTLAELAGERATYLRVPGAGHLVHDDAPDRYRQAVEAFVGSLPGD